MSTPIKCPHAEWDPLGPQAEPPMQKHDIICFHTMAATLEGVRVGFKRDGYHGVESHFGVGGSGKAYQWQDLAFQADANLDGNWHVISIETEDRGQHFPEWEGTNVPPWTREQMDKLVEITAWLCKRFDIPPKLIPNTRPGNRGLAYHRQGIDGNFNPPTFKFPGRVEGGEKWSDAFGKVCPGDPRINQLINVIIPEVQEELQPTVERWLLRTKVDGEPRNLTKPMTLPRLGRAIVNDEALRARIKRHENADRPVRFVQVKVRR